MSKEIAVHDGAQSPAVMMMVAIEKGLDLDKVEKAMLLQERWEANEARKAYHLAMADFKAMPFTVFKDKKNKQYDSMYSSEDSLLNTVNPELSKHGLSASFDFDQSSGIKVACIITHAKGHKESVSLSGPPDGSGSKNPLQQIKSTITYLRKATYETITGIASSDEDFDDDGNGAIEYVTEEQVKTISGMIADKNADSVKFCEYFKIDSIEKMPAKRYDEALKLLKAKKKAEKAAPVKKAEDDLKALIDKKNAELGVGREPGQEG